MSKPTIKPIQTHYKGYHFRSRLEARWAVFFDVLGLTWTYEPEGYDMDGVWYLPDFLVQFRGKSTFVEIKAGMPTDEEFRKCELLTLGTKRPLLLIFGSPGIGEYSVVLIEGPRGGNGLYQTMLFIECCCCDEMSLAYGPVVLPYVHAATGNMVPSLHIGDRIANAFETARSHRFGT